MIKVVLLILVSMLISCNSTQPKPEKLLPKLDESFLSNTKTNCHTDKPSSKILNCEIPDYLNLDKLGFVDDTWKRESMLKGVLPTGLRMHVDWRYKFGDRPEKREDDEKFFNGHILNPYNTPGQCTYWATQHAIDYKRIAQTNFPYENFSPGHWASNDIWLNDSFERRIGIVKHKKSDKVPLADCTDIKIVDGESVSDTYEWYQAQSGGVSAKKKKYREEVWHKKCKPSDEKWWNEMAFDGLNGRRMTPDSTVYRGGYDLSSIMKMGERNKDKVFTGNFEMIGKYKGYNENAFLMHYLNRHGAIYLFWITPKTDSRKSNWEYYARKEFYGEGKKYPAEWQKYGTDMLIGKEKKGQKAFDLSRKGNQIGDKNDGKHAIIIIGYRWIPESPKDSYYILLDSHGGSEKNGNGVFYMHMPLEKSTPVVQQIRLKAHYFNKHGMPIRSEFDVSEKQCRTDLCEFDKQSKTCKCVAPIVGKDLI